MFMGWMKAQSLERRPRKKSHGGKTITMADNQQCADD